MLDEIRVLRKVFLYVAGPEFAFDKKAYIEAKQTSKLAHHCFSCSSYIKEAFGGELMVAKVGENLHYWNRLPDGTEVDLTSCQYGGDGFQPVVEGKVCTKKFRPLRRYERFKARVDELLGIFKATESVNNEKHPNNGRFHQDCTD